MPKHDSAKYAFFYMLSLVGLVFMAVASGMVIFQVINKYIPDAINQYSGSFSPEFLKFAIAALIIASPIYYITSRYLYKSLFKGELDKDAGVRKWLTYFILLVNIIIMIIWLITLIMSLLDGELTTKVALKTLTILIICGSIFSFYLFDIKRKETANVKSKFFRIYLFASLVAVVAIFVTSLFMLESPAVTRNRKLDSQIISNLSSIESMIGQYYNNQDKLPADLDALKTEFNYLSDSELKHPVSGAMYEYKIVDSDNYQLCADFLTTTDSQGQTYYYDPMWSHQSGYQCFNRKATKYNNEVKPLPAY